MKRPARWRQILAFDVFLLAVAIIAGRLATVLHEVVGHGLVAAAFGANVRGFDLTLLGGGLAHYAFPSSVGAVGRASASAGGVVINVVTGILALAWARRAKRPWGLVLA